MKQTTKNNMVGFLKKVMLISVLSSVVFAIEVNQEVELTQMMNARLGPNFTRNARNLTGNLTRGTKAKVVEIKKFSSGNSGFKLEVKDGRLSGQTVWVHFNPRRPSLKLFNADQQQVRNPDQASDATATRDIPATIDPSVPPVSGVAASGDGSRASSDGSLIPINPAVSGTGTVSGTAIPDLVGAANGAVGSTTGGGDAGCRDCSGPSVGGAGASGGPSDTVSGGTTVSGTTSVVPTAPSALTTDWQLALSPEGLLTARGKCNYQGSYRSHSGSIELAVENNRVTHLDARIDNGNCRVSLDTFTQVEVPGTTNIVLRNPAGCTAVVNVRGESRQEGDAIRSEPTRSASNAVMSFGLVQTEGGPCESLCAKVAEGRGFWQVDMNPRSDTCQ